MASSSFPWKYHVFASFHGHDVPKTFLSYLVKQLNNYKNPKFRVIQTIAPSLTQAIRESRISIVVLSKKYASSSWCLDELAEIMKCKEEIGQIVMTVGIYGPAGIGKTTIARAVHSRLSRSFDLSCFMENVSGSYSRDLDEHGLKKCLQEQLLSKILNQYGIQIYHLGAIPERLCDQNVLIILDDVDDLKQLEALANETSWFGPGSLIIVTTEDQELLRQHGINNIYHVDFPSSEEANKIFGRFAFSQSLAPHGYEKLVERVTELCSNLPLGLRVIGSTLRGKTEEDWEYVLHTLENCPDPKIEDVLRTGYGTLNDMDQYILLNIAFFYGYENYDHVICI